MVVWTVVASTLFGGVVGYPILLPTPTAEAADARAGSQAKGRKHSRRAAQLAAANKCRAAIVEYSKALALLKDPVLFFNRGECYRRLADSERALADYRQFLRELPDAPNRTQVAARIAELERVSAPSGVPPPDQVASEPSVLAPARPAAPARLAPGDDLVNISPAPKLASPAPKFADPHIVMVDGPASEPAQDAGGSVLGRWWFWTAIGAVVIGGGVATYFILNSGKTEIPSTALGNYPF